MSAKIRPRVQPHRQSPGRLATFETPDWRQALYLARPHLMRLQPGETLVVDLPPQQPDRRRLQSNVSSVAQNLWLRGSYRLRSTKTSMTVERLR